MIEVKDNFKDGLDLDSSYFKVSKNSYVDALNITRDAVHGNADHDITNIIGNYLVPFLYPSQGTVIEAFPFNLRNQVIFFRYSPTGYNGIYEFNKTTGVVTKIFECLIDSVTDILNFTLNDKITSVNIYPRDEGDLLFFLDSLGRPTGLNITRFKNNEYNPVTRKIIDVIKPPSLIPPYCIYGNDTTRHTNDFKNKLFRFKTRIEYDDFYKSVTSPISKVPLPVKILDEIYSNVSTNNNVINLSLNSGDKNVSKIELLMSFCNKTDSWSDFALVEAIDKTTLGLQSTTYSKLQAAFELRQFINFTGIVYAGTVINIYLTFLPNTQSLTGTYTTLAGDTITDISNGLIASIVALSIGFSATLNGTGLYFDFNSFLYSFDQVEIISTNPNNDNVQFSYPFYNDSVYPTIDLEESIQLYDLVPPKANSQELVNGNVLIYAGITEGYDKDLVPNVVNTINVIPATTNSSGTLNAVLIFEPSPFHRKNYFITFSGVPAIGTVINVKVRRISDGALLLGGTYTTISGDNPNTVAFNLQLSVNAINIIKPLANYPTATALRVDDTIYFLPPIVEVLPPTSLSSANSTPTWKWSTSRNIGIAYFDKNGVTNGILYHAKVTFPEYSETVLGEVNLPYINTKIYHIPPIWAYSFQIYFTQEPTYYLFWETVSVNIDETDYIYFEVTNFSINAKQFPTTEAVLSYTFQDGDRLRLIKKSGTSTVYNDTYDAPILGQISDPSINGTVQTGKTFIKIKKTAPFSNSVFTPNNKFYIIEIYRPGQTVPTTDQTYFECGQQYDIINPELPTRQHGGMVSNQDTTTGTPAEFNFYEGDSYFRNRNVSISLSGVATFSVQDRNFVDFYNSAVSSLQGRPNIIDVNARKATYGALIRFGQAYQPDTNINGLNRFYDKNTFLCDYSFGAIMRLKVRDRYTRVFQELKVGSIPTFAELSKVSTNQVLYQTDKLLNPVQYYVGNVGIGDNATSLASFNFADYFTSNIKGYICRVSQDGITLISVDYKVNSWASVEVPLRTGIYKIYGAFDVRINDYVIALEAVDGSPAQTITFNEETNTFGTFYSFHPEMMCTLGNILISFKDGNLWVHDSTVYNNFYGIQYDSMIKPVFNDKVLEKKTPESLTETASDIWSCPFIETNSLAAGNVNQVSDLSKSNFKRLEGQFHATFRRASNSNGGKVNGAFLKGNIISIEFLSEKPTSLVSLSLLSLMYKDSPLTTT